MYLHVVAVIMRRLSHRGLCWSPIVQRGAVSGDGWRGALHLPRPGARVSGRGEGLAALPRARQHARLLRQLRRVTDQSANGRTSLREKVLAFEKFRRWQLARLHRHIALHAAHTEYSAGLPLVSTSMHLR